MLRETFILLQHLFYFKCVDAYLVYACCFVAIAHTSTVHGVAVQSCIRCDMKSWHAKDQNREINGGKKLKGSTFSCRRGTRAVDGRSV